MSNDITKVADMGALKSLIIGGDMSRLDEAAKVSYYKAVCESLGLNPLTQPFSYLRLNGKEILYANRSCTEQLRKIHGVSVTHLEAKKVDEIYVVTCQVRDANGRTDVGTGAVNIKGLQGDNLANALMKAESKSKRRATLSLCGLGILDESELDTIHGAEPIPPRQERPLEAKFIPAAERPKPAPVEPDAEHITREHAKHLDEVIDGMVTRAWLFKRFNVERYGELTRKQYDEIVSGINQLAHEFNVETEAQDEMVVVEA